MRRAYGVMEPGERMTTGMLGGRSGRSQVDEWDSFG
jgi:hypothetical protein